LEGVYNHGLRSILRIDQDYYINGKWYNTQVVANGSYFGINAGYNFTLFKNISRLKNQDQ